MQTISDSELVVMTALWELGEATGAEVVERVQSQTDWHNNTIKTLLSRLVSKKFVASKGNRRPLKYFPKIDQADYRRAANRSFIEKLYGGKAAPLVAAFVEDEQLSSDDIASLKSLISQWEQDNG